MPPTSLSLFGVEKSYKSGSRPVIFEIADQVGNDGGTTIWGLCFGVLLVPQSGDCARPGGLSIPLRSRGGPCKDKNLSAVASDFLFLHILQATSKLAPVV